MTFAWLRGPVFTCGFALALGGCGPDLVAGPHGETGGAGGHGGVGQSTSTGAGGQGGSGMGGQGGSGGASCVPACNDPVAPDCETITCDNGKCTSTYSQDGTTLPDAKQTAGNCKAKVCDAAGNAVDVNDDLDVPNDSNDCTTDTCVDGVAKNDPVALGTACSNATQVCDAAGACVACNVDADCKDVANPSCDAQKCVPTACVDKKQNGDETDVDCGGSCGATCAAGKACIKDGDCADLICTSLMCAAAVCDDGIKNGTESDKDCGGACPGCGPSKKCAVDADCGGKQCDAAAHTCTPNCADGFINNDETDLDCGGSCSPCASGKQCGKAGDCASGFCVDGVCCDAACGGECQACNVQGAAGTCTNIAVNGTDDSPVCAGASACDGAGACKKANGETCAAAGDCAMDACADGFCCDAPCNGICEACSGALTGGANGTCGKISNGTDPKDACAGADVCATGGKCQCSDGVKGGSEADVDCGGAICAKCGEGRACGGAADCTGGVCNSGKCEGPSCAGGLDCGGLSCCDTPVVTGGTFPMGRSAVNADPDYYAGGPANELPEHKAVVADFRLDTFEVTVGRFRKFVTQFDGTPPAVDAGAHPLIANSGWQAAWNASLAAGQAALVANLKCDATYQTWTDAPGANEAHAINCVSWYEAAAFCTWDGGRMPTEAEWEYASAGGSDNRLYPWGSTDPSATKPLANDVYSDKSPLIAVGSHPSGNGKWGHRDLAGGMYEWSLDLYDANWYAGGGQGCSNCANLVGSQRVVRGGSWYSYVSNLRAALRDHLTPTNRYNTVGFRCARRAP